MGSWEYCRREAERCRKLAASSSDPDAVRRWGAVAADYDKLAEALDRPPSIVPPVSPQRQPMQQQQSKKEPER